MDANIALPTTLLLPRPFDYDRDLNTNATRTTLTSEIDFPSRMEPYVKDFITTLVRDIDIATNLQFQLPEPLFDIGLHLADNGSHEHQTLATQIPHHVADVSQIAFVKDSNGKKRRLALAEEHEAFQSLQNTGIYKRGNYHITFSWYPGRYKTRTWRHQAWAATLYEWTVKLPLTLVGSSKDGSSILLGLQQLVVGIGVAANRLAGGVVPSLLPKYTSKEIETECSKAYFEWLTTTQEEEEEEHQQQQDSSDARRPKFVVAATEIIDLDKARIIKSRNQKVTGIIKEQHDHDDHDHDHDDHDDHDIYEYHDRTKRVQRYPVIYEEQHPHKDNNRADSNDDGDDEAKNGQILNLSHRLDFRTHVPYIRDRVHNILAEAREATGLKMTSQRMTIIASRIADGDNELDAINGYLDQWFAAYLEAIASRKPLIDALSQIPNLTATVLQEEKARFLVSRIMQVNQNDRQKRIETAMQSWENSHPIQKTNPEFTSRQLARVTAKVEESVPTYQGLAHALVEMKLDDVALLLDTEDKFQRSKILANLQKALKKERTPGIVEIVFLKLPYRWTVERKHQSVQGGLTLYELNLYRKVHIRSSIPLWRLQILGARYLSWIWNSSFFWVQTATVALRRWNMFRDSFDIRLPSISSTTGRFNTRPIRTVRGRLLAIWEWKRRIVEKARAGEHIIRLREGVYLDMCWAHVWTTLGVGLSSASIVGYSIVETALVTLGAGLALVTSPIWSLVGNLGRYLFNAVIYDCELNAADNAVRPLLRNGFGLMTIGSSAVRGIFHVCNGAAIALFGEVCNIWNGLWHGFMTALLRWTEVPTRAEGFFWSTSGPGMKNPFVLIDADTSTLAILVHLSLQELSAARQEMFFVLGEPRRTLEERVHQESGQTMHLKDIGFVSRVLERIEVEARGAFRGFRRLLETERHYQRILQGVKGNSKIRMTAQELETLTTRAVPIVTKFYIERYFPRLLVSDVTQFWERCQLVPGDWHGLVNYILSVAIFSNEIVVPFEAAVDDLVVDANRVSGLERIIEEALQEQGIVTGESTNYRVGHPIQTKDYPLDPSFHDIPIRFLLQPIVGK